MKNATANRLATAFIGLLVLNLVVYGGLGFFSRIIADDYCTAAIGQNLNAWEGMLHWYENWSGNYSNFFVKTLVAPYQPQVHSWQTIGVIVLWGFVLGQLLKHLCRYFALPFTAYVSAALALLFVFITIDTAPSRQNIFWMGSLIPYTFPLILVTLNVLIFLAFFDNPIVWQYSIAIFISMILVFLIAGFAEIFATFQFALWVVLMVGLWMYLPEKRRRVVGFILPLLIISVVAVVISLVAPGNYVRQSRLDYYAFPGWIEFVVRVIQFTLLVFIVETYAIVAFVFSFFGVLVGVGWLRLNGVDVAALPFPKNPRWAFLVSACVALFLVASVVTPPLYGSGTVVPRTLLILRFVQVVLFALWGYWLAVLLAKHKFPGQLTHRPLYRITFITLMVFIFFVPLISLVRNVALIPDFAVYASGWDARHQEILAAYKSGETKIIVESLHFNIEDYLQLEKIESDTAQNWVNSCASSYYGIEVFAENID